MILETALFLSTLFIISRIYLFIRKLCLSLQQIKAPRQGEYPGMLKLQKYTTMKGLKTILNGLLLLTMAVGTMSCQGLIDAVLGNDDVPVSTDVPSAKKMLLEVMGERYEVALPASEPLNLRTLTNEFDITVKVLNASDFSSVTIGGKPLAGGVCTLRAPEVLDASTYIDVNYATGSQQGSIKLARVSSLEISTSRLSSSPSS